MSAGYPGTMPGGLTTGFDNIGAVDKLRTGAAGYPGVMPGGLSTGYTNIGAIQKDSDITGTLAATETGADVCAATGTVLVSGTMAASESGDDTCEMAGTVTGGVVTAAGGAGPKYLGKKKNPLLPDVSDEMRMTVLAYAYV